MQLATAIQPGTRIVLVYNGFPGHLLPDSPFANLLTKLSQLWQRFDVECTLLVPNEGCYNHFLKTIGDPAQFGWQLVADDYITRWPSMVLVREDDERYSAYYFEVDRDPVSYNEAMSKEWWDCFEHLVSESPEPAKEPVEA